MLSFYHYIDITCFFFFFYKKQVFTVYYIGTMPRFVTGENLIFWDNSVYLYLNFIKYNISLILLLLSQVYPEFTIIDYVKAIKEKQV